MLMIIFAVCMEKTISLNFEPKDYQSGLTFKQLSNIKVAYESFSLLYYTDLSEYYSLKEKMEICLNGIDTINKAENETIHIDPARSIYYNQLYDNMIRSEEEVKAYLISDDYPTFTNRDKPKRAIEIIGKMLNWAFGLMDADTAREIDKKIRDNQENTNALKLLDAEISMFARENVITNRDKFNLLANRINGLITNLTEIEKGLNKARTLKYIVNEMSYLMETIYLEHNLLTNQIIKHVEGAIFGKVSHLIPNETLSRDLIVLKHKLLPDKQSLPIYLGFENSLSIFKYSATRASLFKERMMIEITVPRVDREIYFAYEITPIPIKTKDFTSIIIPSFSHILINPFNFDYIPLQADEYKSAISSFVDYKILIRPRENIYHDHAVNCEMNIFMNSTSKILPEICNLRIIPNSNIFIPLNQIDQYYLSLHTPMTLFQYCYEKPLEKTIVNSSGILTIGEFCQIRADHITLRNKISKKISRDIVIPLTTSFISNATINNLISIYHNMSFNALNTTFIPQILIQDNINDYNHLADKAEDLIQTANRIKELEIKPLEKYSHSSIFAYWNYFCYVFIALFFLKYFAGIYSNLCKKSSN